MSIRHGLIDQSVVDRIAAPKNAPDTGHSPLYGGLCQAAGVAMVTSGRTTKADVLCQMA